MKFRCGRQVKNYRVLNRMDDKIERIDRGPFIQAMCDIGVASSLEEGGKIYDAFTATLNGLLAAWVKRLPKGTHVAIFLKNCISVNLCWIKGRGVIPDYPSIWTHLSNSKNNGRDSLLMSFNKMRWTERANFYKTHPRPEGSERDALRRLNEGLDSGPQHGENELVGTVRENG
jgi:hypothetical protein